MKIIEGVKSMDNQNPTEKHFLDKLYSSVLPSTRNYSNLLKKNCTAYIIP